MFWVSEQRLLDHAKTIHRNSWMTELEMKNWKGTKLKMIVTNKEEERSADDRCSNLEEEVRDILTALEADEEIGNLEEEVPNIEEIAEMLERRQKDLT